MLAGYSFQPRAWVIALALAAAGAGIALGHWQAGRAEQKRADASQLERMSVTGVFVARYTVLLDNKLRAGRPGYEVVTPLRLSGSERHVLVNRGWVAAPRTRDTLPQVRTPSAQIEVEGLVRERFPRLLEIREQAGESVRQTVDIGAFARETGLTLEPYYIEQHSAAADGLERQWQPRGAGVEKHESYALQWYFLAALAIVLGLVFSFRRVAAS
jgi:surfeit locus 1 family protein